MKIKAWILCVTVSFILSGCNAQEEPPRRDATPTGSKTHVDVPDEPARIAPEATGHVRFTVDGAAREFEFIVPEHTSYHRLASKIHAQPSPGSKEVAYIIFSNVDLAELDYPIELPLPRDAVDPTTPMMAAIMIGFGYIDQHGNEWAGPGRIRLESFGADGVLEGSFSGASLPHTDKQFPDIVLDNGRFSVGLWTN